MAKVVLASALTRHLPDVSTPGEVALQTHGATLTEALGEVFVRYPALRSYILDEHGGVRRHVAIFVDGIALSDKAHPQAALTQSTEIYIMQALSGG
ncbi:MAG: MoaD/ThiS family protein [Gammaproteobacteria bacterium]|nr:MAG: MoaD/ThiS family protein [Gammaproteobacteria bacterium]